MKRSATHIIGRQPVLEALRQGIQLERVFIQKNSGGEVIDEIRKLAQGLQIPLNTVPLEKLNSLSRSNHQGVIGLNSIIQYHDLQDAIDHVVGSGKIPLFLMLDGVTDVRNIGAIARSALCCDAQLLIIPDKGIGAFNEEALKSSAGALQRIMVSRVNSLLKALDTLHLNGIKVVASAMKSNKSLLDLNFTEPTCIIMGSEDKGIQPYMLKSADQLFTIPMQGDFDSFNVGVAAGIILFEASRQRMEAP